MKRLLFAIIAAAFALCTQAQAVHELEFGVDLSTVKGAKPTIGLQYTALKPLNNSVRMGAGFGLSENTSFDTNPSIPLYMRTEFDFTKSSNVVPYLSFDLGYALNCGDMNYNVLFINPVLTARFNDKFYLGVGYQGGTTFGDNSAWGNSIELRFGVILGKGYGRAESEVRERPHREHKLAKKIGEKTHFGVELAAGFGMKKNLAKGEYSGDSYKNSGMKILLPGINWMYDFNEHWSTGLGVNMGVVGYKAKAINEYAHGLDEHERFLWETIWRTEYTHNEVAKNLKPYADLNFGYGAGGFVISPQVGVKYKDRYKAGISFSGRRGLWSNFNQYNAREDKPVGNPTFEIHLGVDF